MYYRLFDNQCHCYMATGNNARSLKELIEDYWQYKSVDMEQEDLEICKKLKIKEQKSFIITDGFTIETSNKPFEEF